MKIGWQGCVLSVVALLLLIPLGYFGVFVFFAAAFNDNGSPDGYAMVDRGLLYLKIGLGVGGVLFVGGVAWAIRGSGQPVEPPDSTP